MLFVIIIITLVLNSLPLTNILGYEFSAVMAVCLSFISGLVTIYYLNRGDDNLSLKQILTKGWFLFILLLITPAILSLINTIFIVNCPVFDGSLFYFVLTFPSFIIGSFIGIIISYTFPRYRYLIFTFFYLIILLLPVLEIYSNPQVYFYNPIIGYFPGNIYDENITINFNLILYRIINLAMFGIFAWVAVSYKKLNLRLKVIPGVTFIVIFILFFLIKPVLGFSTNHTRLYNELGMECETEHFRIICPKELSEESINNLALHHEYYYNFLEEYFKCEPNEKIVSYVFKNATQKRILFGAGNADVAKPWLNQIYINYATRRGTLKHELAHVFSAEFGVTPFKVACNINPALIEGIAMAAENDYDGNDIHKMAYTAFNNGYKISIETLFSGLTFFGNASSLSYIYTGSFIKYLVETEGIDKVKLFYADNDIAKHYGKKFSQIEREYFNFLSKLDVRANEHKANLYFGYKPLIQKICARYVAKKIKEGWSKFNSGLYNESILIFEELISCTNNYLALSGLVNSYIELGELDKAEVYLEDALIDYKGTSYFYNINLMYGDLLIRKDDFDSAKAIFESVKKMNPNINYSNIAQIRLDLIKEGDIAARYIKENNETRYDILTKRLTNENFYSIIPSLITLSNSLGKEYLVAINSLDYDLIVDDFQKSYAFLKLSEYAEDHSDFSMAHQFVNTAMEFKGDSLYSSILNEQNKILEWIKLNKDKEEVNYKFSNYGVSVD